MGRRIAGRCCPLSHLSARLSSVFWIGSILHRSFSRKNALGEAFTSSLESAKWKLWHGNADDALTKLAVLRDNITDEGHRSKLTGLYEYLHRNQAYLVNYDARAQANQTYTSQVAESHIEALINARHKRTKKMQWTREGAHHVLQIRAMMASDEWESKCQAVVLLALGAAA